MGDRFNAGNPQTYTLTRTTRTRAFFWCVHSDSCLVSQPASNNLDNSQPNQMPCNQPVHPTTTPHHPDPQTPRNFTAYMTYGIWHSLVAFFVCWYGLAGRAAVNVAGAPGDLPSAGTAVFICLIVTVTMKLSIRTRNWNWITWVTYGLSLAALLPFVVVMGILGEGARVVALADMVGVAGQLFNFPAFWLSAVILAPAMALIPDLVITGFARYFNPSMAVLLQVGAFVVGGGSDGWSDGW